MTQDADKESPLSDETMLHPEGRFSGCDAPDGKQPKKGLLAIVRLIDEKDLKNFSEDDRVIAYGDTHEELQDLCRSLVAQGVRFGIEPTLDEDDFELFPIDKDEAKQMNSNAKALSDAEKVALSNKK